VIRGSQALADMSIHAAVIGFLRRGLKGLARHSQERDLYAGAPSRPRTWSVLYQPAATLERSDPSPGPAASLCVPRPVVSLSFRRIIGRMPVRDDCRRQGVVKPFPYSRLMANAIAHDRSSAPQIRALLKLTKM
jgi:hypothetical protein